MNKNLTDSPSRPSAFLLIAALWLSHPGFQLTGQISIITTVAGNGSISFGGDGFAANSAGVPNPADVTIDATGTLYITSSGRIRRVAGSGSIDTLATIPLPTISGFPIPSQTWTTGITFWNGNFYVAQISSIGSRIMRVDSQGASSVFLNPGTLGLNLGQFIDLVMDGGGNLFIADGGHHRIIRRNTAGAVSVYAGRTDVNAFGGDGGPATSASLNTPAGLAIDGAGNLYIADSGNHRIRRVDGSGTITTVAGSGGPAGGFAGDGGPAVNSRLDSPLGIVLDGAGILYIADTGNSRIRRVDREGTITTVAGSGVTSNCFSSACYSGDNGPAVGAQLSGSIQGLALDAFGNLYIADGGNNRVRKVAFNAAAGQLSPPTIQASGGIGVVNGASFQPVIASGSWVTIFGQHLAPILAPGRTWRSSEIVDGKLPTTLEGVSVRFNGKSGYPYFVGPGQLNVLAPDSLPTGVISVEVETPSGIARTNANVATVAPGLFSSGARGPLLGTIYAAAVHTDGTTVGHPSLIPGSRPAQAGDAIALYGTGFGPTSPSRPSGELINLAPLATPYVVRINGDRVASGYGGIVGPGLYQINIVMPALTGEQFALVEVDLAGRKTDPWMVLAVTR